MTPRTMIRRLSAVRQLRMGMAFLLFTSVGFLAGKVGCSAQNGHLKRAVAKPPPSPATTPGPRKTVVPPATRGRPTISLSKLQSTDVLGDLGWPLGSILTVEGQVVGDDYRRRKADLGKTLLKIHQAGGKTLLKPVILPLRGRQGPGSLKPGSRVRLLGYETGAYVGVPAGVFKYVPAFTTVGYGFATWFQLIKVQP